jgi:hypothetical protein
VKPGVHLGSAQAQTFSLWSGDRLVDNVVLVSFHDGRLQLGLAQPWRMTETICVILLEMVAE